MNTINVGKLLKKLKNGQLYSVRLLVRVDSEWVPATLEYGEWWDTQGPGFRLSGETFPAWEEYYLSEMPLLRDFSEGQLMVRL